MAQEPAQEEKMTHEEEPRNLSFAQRQAVEENHNAFDQMAANYQMHHDKSPLKTKANGNSISNASQGDELKQEEKLEESIIEESHPTNSGLGLAEGQEPQNFQDPKFSSQPSKA